MVACRVGRKGAQSIPRAARSKIERAERSDPRESAGRADLQGLVADAAAFVQGYRPGGLQALGFGPREVAGIRPGIVYVSLSAYGHRGPWSLRRGFDSLVQTATGFNHAEMLAAGADQPRAMPVQILDAASGLLIAFAVQAGWLRQAREGGSWHARISLARTAAWLRSLGRVEDGWRVGMPDLARRLQSYPSGWGELAALPHAARFSHTPPGWDRPSVPPGTHPPRWPPS